jgi:hypothetical protein
MSRIDELKKQHKDLALNDLDLMKMTMPDQAIKYVEVLAKLAKSKYKEITAAHDGEDNLRTACLSALAGWGIDYNYLETLETPVLWMLWNRMETLLGQNNFKLFIKFANLNERGLISNNDVTSYKSFNEIEQAVSLAEIKLIDKELEKQIIKVHEDDEWLLLKPLSLEASMKYGASTKWCTTMDKGTYFARYSRWGILIYALNKKTGYKFASFKNLDRDRDNEFSFWNPADHKIDPLDTHEIPIEIISIIRNEININRVTNKSLMDEAAQKKLYIYENPEEDYPQQPVQEGVLRFTSTGTATIGNNFTYTASNNIGMGTTTPNTQLSIGGDIVVRDGSIRMTDNEGVERMRITEGGMIFADQPDAVLPIPPPKNPYSEQIEQTRQDLFREIEQHLEQTQERVVEERAQQQSLLNDLELGTLNEESIKRMQQLAGININGVTIKLNGVEIIDDEEAEQTDVPSEQPVNWFNKLKNKIKNGYERITTKKDIQQPNMESHSDILGGNSSY